jgi:hypothetical protein
MTNFVGNVMHREGDGDHISTRTDNNNTLFLVGACM